MHGLMREGRREPVLYSTRCSVSYEAVKEVAGAITPVPGGVGWLMTVAMLVANTVKAAGG